jgi:hypothetical protein
VNISNSSENSCFPIHGCVLWIVLLLCCVPLGICLYICDVQTQKKVAVSGNIVSKKYHMSCARYREIGYSDSGCVEYREHYSITIQDTCGRIATHYVDAITFATNEIHAFWDSGKHTKYPCKLKE